jgi:hypothetical protein
MRTWTGAWMIKFRDLKPDEIAARGGKPAAPKPPKRAAVKRKGRKRGKQRG